MTPEVVGVASAAVSILGAVVAGAMTGWSARRTRRYEHALEDSRRQRNREEQAAAVLSRYREPLLLAAHNLQTRVFNAVNSDYLDRFLHCGDPDEERYARDYTVYVLAEYLCWSEILRRDLRFLDVGGLLGEDHRRLLEHQEQVALVLAATPVPRSVYRVFRGQQRALGELMMVPTGETDGPRHECLGYSAFCARLDSEPDFAGWFARLRADVDHLRDSDPDLRSRLVDLQHRLIDLIDLLDPDLLRLPTRFRAKLAESKRLVGPAREPGTAAAIPSPGSLAAQ